MRKWRTISISRKRRNGKMSEISCGHSPGTSSCGHNYWTRVVDTSRSRLVDCVHKLLEDPETCVHNIPGSSCDHNWSSDIQDPNCVHKITGDLWPQIGPGSSVVTSFWRRPSLWPHTCSAYCVHNIGPIDSLCPQIGSLVRRYEVLENCSKA